MLLQVPGTLTAFTADDFAYALLVLLEFFFAPADSCDPAVFYDDEDAPGAEARVRTCS